MHWIEISKNSLLHNIKQIRSVLKVKTKFMAMVKANAYGHGLKEVVISICNYVDYFGVNTLEEAVLIRKLKINIPILICAPVEVNKVSTVLKYNLELCLHSLENIDQFSKYPIKVHLKINTGMNRLGIAPSEIEEALNKIKSSKTILVGIYSHFFNADSNLANTKKQLSLFSDCVRIVKMKYPNILAHCANTSAVLNLKESHLDLVRVGLGLYGLWPSNYIKQKAKITLNPVLSWKAKIVQKRILFSRQSVGYSATFVIKQKIEMGIIPVGYSDGLDRGLSNSGWVFYKNTPCPIIGRIAMNFTAIDISKGNSQSTKVDTVEIVGKHTTADDIAKLLKTINYEIVARLNPSIPRIVI